MRRALARHEDPTGTPEQSAQAWLSPPHVPHSSYTAWPPHTWLQSRCVWPSHRPAQSSLALPPQLPRQSSTAPPWQTPIQSSTAEPPHVPRQSTNVSHSSFALLRTAKHSKRTSQVAFLRIVTYGYFLWNPHFFPQVYPGRPVLAPSARGANVPLNLHGE